MPYNSRFLIEIATADFSTTQSAVGGGADRIELCAGLSEGGTTPSYGTIRRCREAFDVSLFPIIRPRGGDFLYTEDEYQVIYQDILLCRQVGCDGVVIGLLQADGRIDYNRTARLIEAAYPLEVTFHRAFDRCRDPFEALEQLVELGCQRILTSGQQPGAPAGLGLLRQLVEAADERIVIMPGSGVRADNIRELAEATGAVEFHSSLRSKRSTQMDYIHPSFAKSEETNYNPHISEEEVRGLRDALYSPER